MIQAKVKLTIGAANGEPPLALDFELSGGGMLTLFGPRGAGKTAALEALAGLLVPGEGRILVDDRILFDSAARVNLPPAARPLAYLPPRTQLFSHLTLRENLLFAAGCRRMPRLERHRTVNEMLDRFGLAALGSRLPISLTPAERQRGLIARALCCRPALLLAAGLADGLEAPLRSQLFELLGRVNREWGVSVLMSTSNLEDCFELGGRVAVMIAGKVVQSGSAREVLEQPESLEVARALGGFNLLPAEIVSLDPGRKTSRLRVLETEIDGPYFPGHFRGDRVTLCVRPAALEAHSGAARPGPNQIPLRLENVVELPERVRLRFEGGVAVEMSATRFAETRHRPNWAVEFPAERLRVL